MKYLNKTIEYGLYLLVFLLPWQTRWIIKVGQLNHGSWEYGTYSLYGTDVLLLMILALFIARGLLKVDNFKFSPLRQGFGGQAILNLISNFKFQISNLLIFGLILVSVVSVCSASYKLLALYKFGWLILGAGLFWLITSANYDRLKLIYAWLAGAFFSAGLAVWQFLNQATFANKWLGLAMHKGAELGTSVVLAVGADGIGERWLRAYGSLDHPNMLGGMIVAVILLLIGQIIVRERIDNFQFSPLRQSFGGQAIFNFQIIFNDKIFKFINWLLLLVFIAALFFSFSRSAWLALAAGLIMMITLAVARRDLKSQKRLAETVLVMSLLLFVLFSQYQNLVVTRFTGQGRLEDKSNFERLVSLKESWQIAKKDWLIGVGPGNYTFVLSRATPEQVSYYYQPAHNAFLLVWAEAGIFGLLFFLGLIAYLIIFNFPSFARASEDKQFSINKFSKPSLKIENYKLKIRENDYTNNSIFNISVLTALIVLMFFDHWLLSLHFGVLFFWLVLALVYRQSEENNEQPR